jgi:hypothetical protein
MPGLTMVKPRPAEISGIVWRRIITQKMF